MGREVSAGEILPYPFCGAEPVRLEFQELTDTEGSVHCMACGAYGPDATVEEDGDAMGAAYDGWNRRAPRLGDRWRARQARRLARDAQGATEHPLEKDRTTPLADCDDIG